MDQSPKKWLGTKHGEICVANLIKHRFDAHFVQTPHDATDKILDLSSSCERFGFGGSATINTLGIKDILKAQGKTLLDHNETGLSAETSQEYRREQSRCDCFMCSANALSLSGEIVNMDGIGNRTNAMTFGPQKVIVVAGVNKITPDLESAIRRIREIAAPMRAKSMGVDTPCAVTGKCVDCNSPMRICTILSVLHRKPLLTDISVIIINDDMGF